MSSENPQPEPGARRSLLGDLRKAPAFYSLLRTGSYSRVEAADLTFRMLVQPHLVTQKPQ